MIRPIDRLLRCVMVLASASASANATAPPGANGFVLSKPTDARAVEARGGWLVPYEETIPGTDVVFQMTPIPGGEFSLGSPQAEAGREEDEGPQVRVRVDPMWVGVTEVTWAEYRAYMNLYTPLKQLSDLKYRLSSSDAASRDRQLVNAPHLRRYLDSPKEVDAITCPTPLYDSTFTYEPGEDPDQPAVTMTQFAAKQYTKWLSKITGREYRLPTEAEWEYAARGGTSTAYSFGQRIEDLDRHAWHYGNSEDRTHAVGQKKPNAWGLHDVHGNVSEWVLDHYNERHYSSLPAGSDHASIGALAAIHAADTIWPRAYRGGSWQDDPESLRSAARAGSQDEDWTLSDPNLPVSPWWFTEYESQAVGMRIVRPFKPMDEETKRLCWDADVDNLRYDIDDRLAEGRGVRAAANQLLPEALHELESVLREAPAPAE